MLRTNKEVTVCNVEQKPKKIDVLLFLLCLENAEQVKVEVGFEPKQKVP